MADLLYVQPAELRRTTDDIRSAGSALGRAADGLAVAGSLADQGLDHSGQADDKVATFVRQWRAEHELIGEMLQACTAVLDEAAAAYEAVEAGIVEALTASGG